MQIYISQKQHIYSPLALPPLILCLSNSLLTSGVTCITTIVAKWTCCGPRRARTASFSCRKAREGPWSFCRGRGAPPPFKYLKLSLLPTTLLHWSSRLAPLMRRRPPYRKIIPAKRKTLPSSPATPSLLLPPPLLSSFLSASCLNPYAFQL